MKKETKRKILKILFAISLMICLFLISDTYAKFQEQVSTGYRSSAKRWKIIVNDKVIRTASSLTSVVTPEINENNSYFKENIIAPGSEGYFKMEIDLSKVDVPFTMELQVNQKETVENSYNKLPDFKYYGYYLEEKDIFYYNLPEEYQQVEFIKSTGTQYINTGVKGSIVSGITSKYDVTDTENQDFDGQAYNNDERSVIIFAEYDDDSSEITNKIKMKIYSYKIYMDKIIIRDMVPCYRKSDNVIGLYDMITETFLTNSGTGNFEKGNDIDKNVIDPNSSIYTNKKAKATGYIRWQDGDGTEESPEDELNNVEDTEFILNENNVDVKYEATVIFRQYIDEKEVNSSE